jgi:hypothetical protein
MGRNRSPVEALLLEVISRAVSPPLKAAKFRKTGMNYHRRHGDTVQVVNIQVSQGSTWSEKQFYVNGGIAFDALCGLVGVPVLERPKEYQCDERGTRDRLELLVPGSPDSWDVRLEGDIEMTVVSLRGFIDGLVAELDRIDGLSAYRSHPWFDRFRPKSENAQILYLLGDREGARREVQGLATLFADRRNAASEGWWIERLHLSGLESRLTGRNT